ncbi:MAG: hypothetical protein ACYS14_08165 [Planctomycetota bacterium]
MNSQAPMAISAVLLSWRRPENLPQIVRELRKNPLIKEVLIWNNNPQIALESDEAIIINSAQNFLCVARYCLVPLTKHPLIWFQDDDLLISAEQLDAIVSAYSMGTSRIYGCRGRNLIQGRYDPAIVYGECDIILGQSMLFHKKLFYEVAPTFHAMDSIERGDDIAFSLLCRRKHFAVNVEPLVDLGEHDEHALWRQPGHFSVRQHIVDHLLEAMQ